MDENFTTRIENDISDYIEAGDGYEYEDFVGYIKDPNYFRPFSEGLTELLKRSGIYTSDTDKINFLYNKLVELISTIPLEIIELLKDQISGLDKTVTKVTIKNWFTLSNSFEENRPDFKKSSRDYMYQICFALNLDLTLTRWFFRNVYFSRAFNLRNIEEACYYFCLKNNLPYSKALDLIIKVNSYDILESDIDVNTQHISNTIENISDEKEFLDFMKEYKNSFNIWNQSASDYINELLSKIQGNEHDKEIIEKYTKKSKLSNGDKKCSLIIREFLHHRSAEDIKDLYANEHITSIDFMLNCIFDSSIPSFSKDKSLPKLIRTNFPNKKLFSQMFKEINNSISYDSIRKIMILLSFYKFWCMENLKSNKDDEDEDLAKTWWEEINHHLERCGYETLFPGNPYDLLFVFSCIQKEYDPLTFLRQVIDDFNPEEDKK